MYTTCMQCLWRSEVGTGCPRTGVEDGYELSYGSWKVNLCPYARVAGALKLCAISLAPKVYLLVVGVI